MRTCWARPSPDGHGYTFPRFLLAGAAVAALLSVPSWAEKHEKPESAPPALRIPTEPLNYHPLSNFYLMARSSSSSLDFIDNANLLFTFRSTGLLKRLPGCPPDDEDQLIRAVVIHLPEGNVVRSAEWRMHDRGRYLWTLGGGKFLVRERDSLMITDSSLELQPYIESDAPIRLVKLSPDGRLLLIETEVDKRDEEEREKLAQQAWMAGLAPPGENIQLAILRVPELTLVARQRMLSVHDLPLIAAGYLENLAAKGDHWKIRYVPFLGKPADVAEVASSCRPNETPLNDTTVFVSTCSERNGDHFIDTFSLDGKRLWSYRWDSHYIWPTTADSADGRRIAFSVLRVAHAIGAMEPFDETEVQAQRVEVLDADTGKLELTQFAKPILSAGQNYALSPDGSRFAVLRENAIEVYDLPALTTVIAGTQ